MTKLEMVSKHFKNNTEIYSIVYFTGAVFSMYVTPIESFSDKNGFNPEIFTARLLIWPYFFARSLYRGVKKA